jgi:regulator of replication initiation timing
MIEALLVGIGTTLIAFGATAKYLLSRLKKLEVKEEESDTNVRIERDALRKRVSDLEERVKRVPILEEQVQSLISQMGSMNDRIAEQGRENTMLKAENRRLEKERIEKEAQIQELEIENRTFRQVFTLMGIERLEAEKPNKESAGDEPKRPPALVVAGEGAQTTGSEQKVDTTEENKS